MKNDGNATELDISLAPGAEDVALCSMLVDIIRSNLKSKPEKITDFLKLNATVYIQAVDAEVDLTLVFLRGRLKVFAGKEGTTQISIITDSATLMDLNNITIKGGLPNYFDETGRAIVGKMLRGKLKIKGLFTHLVALTRLTRLLSVV